MLPGKVYTPEVVLEAAWRRKWLVLLPFVAVLVGITAYANSLPNVYRSETLILVVPQRIPESYVRATVTTRIEDRLRTIKEQILSRTRLEQVILEFNLYPEARARLTMEEVVEAMRPNVFLDTVRGDSFRVAFVANDAETPAKVATRLAEMFIEEGQRDRTLMAEDTNNFLESQLNDAKVRLVDHERKLEDFKMRHAGELPSQFQSNLQVIQATQGQVQTLAESVNRDRDRRLLLEKSLAEVQSADFSAGSMTSGTSSELIPPTVTPVDELETARNELRALERRLKPTHPDLVAKKRSVAALEAQLIGEPTTPSVPGAAPAPSRPLNTSEVIRRNRIRQIQVEIDKVDSQIAQKEKESQRLQAVVTEYQARVEAVPTRETEMTELMRDYDTLQRIYTSLLAKKEDSNIAANLERKQVGEQFKILDRARPAEVPFSPNRVRMILMGAVAGLFLGLAMAALMEYRDTSLRSEEDIVRTLALPVLAVIPFMESPMERRGRRFRLAFTGAVGLLALAGAGIVVASNYNIFDWLR